MNMFSIHKIRIIGLTALFFLLNACASGGGGGHPNDRWDDDYHYRKVKANRSHLKFASHQTTNNSPKARQTTYKD